LKEVEASFKANGFDQEYEQIEKQVSQGKDLIQVLKDGEFRKVFEKESGTDRFFSFSDAQTCQVLLAKMREIQDLSFENFKEKVNGLGVQAKEAGLVEKYFPHLVAHELILKNVDNKKTNKNDSNFDSIKSLLKKERNAKRPNSKIQKDIDKLIKRGEEIKKIQSFLLQFAEGLFEPEKLEMLRKDEDKDRARSKVLYEVLTFFQEQNVQELSVDFEKNLFGMFTTNPTLKKKMAKEYDNMMMYFSKKTLGYLDEKNEEKTRVKDYARLQTSFAKLIEVYSKTRSLDDRANIQKSGVSLAEMTENVEDMMTRRIELMMQKKNQAVEEGELIEQESAEKVLEAKLAEWVGECLRDGGQEEGVVEDLLNMHSVTRDINLYQGKLETQMKIEKDPEARFLLKKMIQGTSLKFEEGFLMENEKSLAVLQKMKETVQERMEQVLKNVEILHRHKHGLLSKTEQSEITQKTQGIMQKELQEMYGSSVNLVNPEAKDLPRRESASKEDLEEQELEAILDGGEVSRIGVKHTPDLLVRKDFFIRRKVMVSDKRKYLQELEEWKNKMREKGLEGFIPVEELSVDVVEMPQINKKSSRTVFNTLRVSNEDSLQRAETTGIVTDNWNLQLRLQKVEKDVQQKAFFMHQVIQLILSDIFLPLFWTYALGKKINYWICQKNTYKIPSSLVQSILEKSVQSIGLDASDIPGDVASHIANLITDLSNPCDSLIKDYIKSLNQDSENLGKEIRLKYEMLFFDLIGSSENELQMQIIEELFSESLNTIKSQLYKHKPRTVSKKYFKELNMKLMPKFKDLIQKQNKNNYFVDYQYFSDLGNLENHFQDLYGNKKSVNTPSFIDYSTLYLALKEKIELNSDSKNKIEELLIEVKKKNQLSKYISNRKEDWEETKVSKKYQLIPEEKESSVEKYLYKDESVESDPRKQGDSYQDLLGKEGFLEEKDPGEEDLSGGDKSFVKNSSVVAKKLMTQLKFHLKGEHLVLEEIEKAKELEPNLLAEAVKYISETSELRGDRKNSFWTKNVDEFESGELYENEVINYNDMDRLAVKEEPKKGKEMTVQGVYTGLILKKRLKNYLVEALKEKMEQRKHIESKSEVQGDFIKFILDNFHGSGVQKYTLEKWLSEIPDFGSFYENWKAEIEKAVPMDSTEEKFKSLPRMTKKEIRDEDTEQRDLGPDTLELQELEKNFYIYPKTIHNEIGEEQVPPDFFNDEDEMDPNIDHNKYTPKKVDEKIAMIVEELLNEHGVKVLKEDELERENLTDEQLENMSLNFSRRVEVNEEIQEKQLEELVKLTKSGLCEVNARKYLQRLKRVYDFKTVDLPEDEDILEDVRNNILDIRYRRARGDSVENYVMKEYGKHLDETFKDNGKLGDSEEEFYKIEKSVMDKALKRLIQDEKMEKMFPMWYTTRVKQRFQDQLENDPFYEFGKVTDYMPMVPEFSKPMMKHFEKFLAENEDLQVEDFLPRYKYNPKDRVREILDPITDPFGIRRKELNVFTPEERETARELVELYKEKKEEMEEELAQEDMFENSDGEEVPDKYPYTFEGDKKILEYLEENATDVDMDKLADFYQEKYDDKMRRIQKDLKPLQRFKDDVVFYITTKVVNHKENLLDKFDNGRHPKGVGVNHRIQKIVHNRKNKLINTFYDNKALQEFNTLRRMRDLAMKSQKFKYDDIHRNVAEKGRDLLLETKNPRLIQDQIFLGQYQVEHPDDNKNRPDNLLDIKTKNVVNPQVQSIRNLQESYTGEHEVDEHDRKRLSMEPLIPGIDEFKDIYKFDPMEPSRIELNDLHHLKTMVMGDIYKERPEGKIQDPFSLETATQWFREKYMFYLNDDQMSSMEKCELQIIAYLFYLNKNKKISLGDVFLEMSRRRLNLDPRKYRGVGINNIQKFRTKLTSHFAKKEYLVNVSESEKLYHDLFPADKLTDFELINNRVYFELISNLTKERQKARHGHIFAGNPAYKDKKEESQEHSDGGEGEGVVEGKTHGEEEGKDLEEGELQEAELSQNNTEEFVDETEEDECGINNLLENNQGQEVDLENMPPVCLELELFNLIDLYFSMYNKEDIDRDRRRKSNESRHTLQKFEPVLRVDKQMATYFDLPDVLPSFNKKESIDTYEEDTPDNKNTYLMPVSEFFKHRKIKDPMDTFEVHISSENELESIAEKITEEIVKVCPHVYPEDFGEDPGLKNPEWSIQNQILRRFEDHVSVQSAEQMWRKGVELEFNADDREIPDEDELRDPVRRPDYLKKADYDDAKEVVQKRRLEEIFNDMQEDPFFDSKLKEFFSSCHQMEVQNQYQKHYQHLEKPEEILDRETSGIVKNELMDFLMRYSDIRMQTRDQFYSSYAGSTVKQKQMFQREKSLLFNSANPENYLPHVEENTKQNIMQTAKRIKDFETRFFDSTKHKQVPFVAPKTKYSTSAPVNDIVDLELRLNRLRDKENFSGMHRMYQHMDRHTTDIPFHLDQMDIRQDPQEWVFETIRNFLNEIMSLRLSLEKYMTKTELLKFDMELERVLTRRNLQDAVLKALDQELTTANVLRKAYVKDPDFDEQVVIEASHFDDLQKNFESKVKNQDALHRLYAYDAVMSKKRMTDDELEENHFTMEMLMEEAMGADYNYLLWQKEKNDYQKNGSDSYMEKEGFRSKRYINNEFMARYYGKTYFEECNAFDVYHDMGISSHGMHGLQVKPRVSKEFQNYVTEKSMKPPLKSNVIDSAIESLGVSDHAHSVSKSLGWYFQKMNQELKERN
jgi:hypothetical protein